MLPRKDGRGWPCAVGTDMWQRPATACWPSRRRRQQLLVDRWEAGTMGESLEGTGPSPPMQGGSLEGTGPSPPMQGGSFHGRRQSFHCPQHRISRLAVGSPSGARSPPLRRFHCTSRCPLIPQRCSCHLDLIPPQSSLRTKAYEGNIFRIE